MKRKHVNSILINQTKRRNTIFVFSAIIIIFFILALATLTLHIRENKAQYVEYNHNSDIDYQVFLDESEYFQEGYLGKDNQYISSLINIIKSKFKYEISLSEEDIKYKYSYRIEANVVVKEKNQSKPLYTKREVLYTSPETSTSRKNIKIIENVSIDYDKYNNLIKNFLSLYNLDNTESTLTIDMYVDVVGNCEEFEENAKSKSTMSLIIPLTTKTTGIEISDNLVNTQNNVLKCRKENFFNVLYLIYSLILSAVDIVLIVYLVRYIINTRTAEDIYEKELKKILNNYSSYIQILSNDIDISKYQALSVNNFTDMLEIRDTINQPILMKENEEKTSAYFVIPSENKLLYIYRLEVGKIEKNTNK